MLGEQRHREALPGEIAVAAEEPKSLSGTTEALALRRECRESVPELRAKLRNVEILGESGHRPSVELEWAPRVTACGEQELGPADRRMELILVDRDALPGEKAEERPLLLWCCVLGGTDPVAGPVPRHRLLERTGLKPSSRRPIGGYAAFPRPGLSPFRRARHHRRCAGSSVASHRLADDRVRVVGRQFVGDTADQRG